MKKPDGKPANKEELLKLIFICLSEKGLEKSSIRDFSAYTGMNVSSLYYWFKDKDDIIIETTKYAVSLVLNKAFYNSLKSIKSVNDFCDKLVMVLDKHSEYLNIILQVISSPYYGSIIIEELEKHKELYSDKIEEISKKFDIPKNERIAIIQIFFSIISKNTIIKSWEVMRNEIVFFAKLLDDMGYLKLALE